MPNAKVAYCIAVILATPLAAASAQQPVADRLASSVAADKVPNAKKTSLGLYLKAADAYRAVTGRKDVVLIDTRTRAEVNFLGIPKDAARNIPYMLFDGAGEFETKKGEYKLELNPDFGKAVDNLMREKGLDKNAHVILMCRSGTRSAKAADFLTKVGYKRVYSVIDGFEGDKDKSSGERTVDGWKNQKLPWTYGITAAQVYKSPGF